MYVVLSDLKLPQINFICKLPGKSKGTTLTCLSFTWKTNLNPSNAAKVKVNKLT